MRRRLAPSAWEEYATHELHIVGSTAVRVGPIWQRFHPTRIVAGAGSVRRASAHKGSPLLHRRAPARTTFDPKGSPELSQWREHRRPFRSEGM